MEKKFVVAVFALMLLFSILSGKQSATIVGASTFMEGAWSQRSNMTYPRQYASLDVIDGKIYVIGGRACIDDPDVYARYNYNEMYDPKNNSWTTKAPKPTVGDGGASGVVDGKLYVIGQYPSGTENFMYDPVEDTWTSKAPMPTRRWDTIGLVLTDPVGNDVIYVIGGCVDHTPLKTVEVYCPKNDTWLTKARMNTPRAKHAGSVYNGMIYVFSGSYGVATITAEKYNPETNTWTYIADTPDYVMCASQKAIHKLIPLLGTKLGESFRPNQWYYNPETNTYNQATDFTLHDGLTPSLERPVLNSTCYLIGGGGWNGGSGTYKKKTCYAFTLTEKSLPTAIIVPYDYPTIQEAINAANPGETIYVLAGTYSEHVIVNKTVSLVGEDRRTTILDGNGTGTIILITVDDVDIRQLTIQNGNHSITCTSSFNTIVNNTILNSSTGLELSSSCRNIIRDNVIANTQRALVAKNNSDGNTIRGNTLLRNQYGISISYSNNNTLRYNNMTDNTYNFGVSGGNRSSDFIQNIDASNIVNNKPIYYWVNQQDKIVPKDAGYVAIINSSNIMIRDLAVLNNEQGILFVSTTNSTIKNTTIQNNHHGIYFKWSNSNLIVENTLEENEWSIAIILSFNNSIFHNNFNHHEHQTYIYESQNIWDDGYLSGGNYWNYHVCSGNPSNGSQPCIIGEDNVDHYPFQNFNGWLFPFDTTSPSVDVPSQEPDPDKVKPNQQVIVNVVVLDSESGVENVVLSYTITNGTSWANTTMLYDSVLALYEAMIPAFPAETYVYYEIFAIDYAGNIAVNDNLGQYYGYKVNSPQIQGDIDGDGSVDISDVVLAGIAFGSRPGEPRWNQDVDLNQDGLIDIFDVVVIAINYGKRV